MSDAMITRRGGGGGSSRLQSKSVSITEAPTTVVPDSGYDGMSTVTVDIAAESQIAATSYTPGTQAQTIAANQWLAGAQTIQGDANLLAANIKKGISIFNVAGSYEAALDTNSAILKVVTSTGCSVSVTNGTDTFTQQDAEGFVRTGDANVTEHFFVIPTAAFGTFSVTSTHPTYGDNPKANAVVIGNAGKVYEVLCGGKNIILDDTFGLQSGYTIPYGLGLTYDSRNKRITGSFNTNSWHPLFNEDVPVSAYTHLKVNVSTGYADYHNFSLGLQDEGNVIICEAHGIGGITTAEIDDVVYPTAKMVIRQEIKGIFEIVLT